MKRDEVQPNDILITVARTKGEAVEAMHEFANTLVNLKATDKCRVFIAHGRGGSRSNWYVYARYHGEGSASDAA